MKKNGIKVAALAIILVMCMVVTAFAAISVSITRNFGTADSLERTRDVVITFDSSYPTGGEAIAVSDIGLGTSIYNMTCNHTSGYTVSYDYVSALFVYDVSGYQVVNGTDISNLAVRCRVTGK